eukprot:366568-Chlamydomonas_euryale.AAC.2
MHHAPCIMRHAPCTMHHAPCAMRHASCTMHQSPITMHHAPCITLHAPCTMHHAPCTMHHAPCTMHHAPCAMRHAPCSREGSAWCGSIWCGWPGTPGAIQRGAGVRQVGPGTADGGKAEGPALGVILFIHHPACVVLACKTFWPTEGLRASKMSLVNKHVVFGICK